MFLRLPCFKPCCSWNVLNFLTFQALRSYKLCSYKKKRVRALNELFAKSRLHCLRLSYGISGWAYRLGHEYANYHPPPQGNRARRRKLTSHNLTLLTRETFENRILYQTFDFFPANRKKRQHKTKIMKWRRRAKRRWGHFLTLLHC